MSVIEKNSEILLYDAKMCNPNGDPDENRPAWTTTASALSPTFA